MEQVNRIQSGFWRGLKIGGAFTLVIWAVHLAQWFTPLDFSHWGILPHRWEGLKGIFFSPFLHSQKEWGHIINNSPTLFLGIVMLYTFYGKVADRSLLFLYLFTGLAVWGIAGFSLDSKYAYHIGASGLVYGLISFLFFSGIFRKNSRAVILSLVVVFLYSSMVAGLFPDAEGKISWQSHAAGAFFGMLLAYQYRDVAELGERRIYAYEQESREEKPFLPPDTFEMTREERKRQAEEDEQGFWSSDWTL